MEGKELYTKDHAERLKKSSVGKPYRPSNGSEGEMFMTRFCYRCTKDNPDNSGRNGCDIIFFSMSFEVDHPKYPKEWIYDEDGQPICTAWQQKGA